MFNSQNPNRKTTRFKKWNYNSKGQYFVTGVTRNRDHYFGEIQDGILELTELGKELQNQLKQTPVLRPDMNITLNEFQVMPNHFHAIIEIGNNDFNSTIQYNSISWEVKNKFPNSILRDAMHGVPTNEEYPFNKFGPQRKNLGSIMRGIKSSVTNYARLNHILFDWQPRYFEHLIKDQTSFYKVRNYIRNNVKNWDRDRFNK